MWWEATITKRAVAWVGSVQPECTVPLSTWTVRNIPKFKDRANWSRDTFQPMRRRACVYQETNQNIAPVIKNSQNNGRSRTESVIVSRFSGISCREIFSTFCGLFFLYLLNNAMYRRDLVGFQGRWTSIYYFFDSQIFYEVLDIFPRLSYRLTFIMLNVGIVDNLEFW